MNLNRRALTSKRIARLGAPQTVIDVGVGFGTASLYEAFPEARILLVEPLAEFEDHLKRLCRTYKDCRYYLAAAGKERIKRELSVNITLPERSSFLRRTALTKTGSSLQNRLIETVRLDDLSSELSLDPPFGIKIDTEGYELEVIEGAAGILKETAFVIAEVSVMKRFEIELHL